jgi:DNA-binding transcriptional regulator YiaG
MTARELHAMRRRAGLTQAGLAARMGVDPITVSRWERGAVEPPEPMARLARLLCERASMAAPAPRPGRKLRRPD